MGIQALDRTACQGMHRSLRLAAATREKRDVNERDSARRGLVSQEKYILLVGVGFRSPARFGPTLSRQREEFFWLEILG